MTCARFSDRPRISEARRKQRRRAPRIPFEDAAIHEARAHLPLHPRSVHVQHARREEDIVVGAHDKGLRLSGGVLQEGDKLEIGGERSGHARPSPIEVRSMARLADIRNEHLDCATGGINGLRVAADDKHDANAEPVRAHPRTSQ